MPMTLGDLWDLDIQTIADIRTILRYQRDALNAMTTVEEAAKLG